MNGAGFKLVIEWEGPGTPIRVNGPIGNKMVCYAMLEGAKDAVREYVERHQALITLAPPRPPDGPLRPGA